MRARSAPAPRSHTNTHTGTYRALREWVSGLWIRYAHTFASPILRTIQCGFGVREYFDKPQQHTQTLTIQFAVKCTQTYTKHTYENDDTYFLVDIVCKCAYVSPTKLCIKPKTDCHRPNSLWCMTMTNNLVDIANMLMMYSILLFHFTWKQHATIRVFHLGPFADEYIHAEQSATNHSCALRKPENPHLNRAMRLVPAFRGVYKYLVLT